jgi:hypothetical protein
MQALLAAQAARILRVERQLGELQRVHDSLVAAVIASVNDSHIEQCGVCQLYGSDDAIDLCAAYRQCQTQICAACRGPVPWRCPRCGTSNVD